MCGFLTIVGDRWATTALTLPLDTLARRGPDARGTSGTGRGIHLGHRRLSIIDIEGGTQPFASDDGQLPPDLQRRALQLPRAAQRARTTKAFTFHHPQRHRGAASRHASRGARERAGEVRRHVRLRPVGRTRTHAAGRARSHRRQARVLRRSTKASRRRVDGCAVLGAGWIQIARPTITRCASIWCRDTSARRARCSSHVRNLEPGHVAAISRGHDRRLEQGRYWDIPPATDSAAAGRRTD